MTLETGGCGSFYSVAISHPSFKGLSTIKQHRLVNALLAEQIKGMHGIQVRCFRSGFEENGD
jgi:stress-induced morphogen